MSPQSDRIAITHEEIAEECTPHFEVVIVQRRLTHYRAPLFVHLRALLEAQNIKLRLLHGMSTKAEAAKADGGNLPWAERLPTTYWFGGRFCWQPFGAKTSNADLVIITQENRLLYNLWALLVGRPIGRPKCVAFWGHGANLQADDRNVWRERFKRALIKQVDWWFAYSNLSADLVRAAGFPVSRITILNNAVDTRALAQQCDEISEAEISSARDRLDLKDAHVCLFLGSLYEEKRLPFLLEVGENIFQRNPLFRLVVCGDGPQRQLVERAARLRPWVRFLGMQQGRDKAIALRLADLMLNPGLVGLGILDAFVAGIPLITTDCRIHSPEIAYLVSGENGVMTANTVAAFSDTVIHLLQDERERRRLGGNARSTAAHYTIENMAQRFRDGILSALQTPI